LITVGVITEDEALPLKTGTYDFLSEPMMGCSEKNRMFVE
jgi:hypothetical protein